MLSASAWSVRSALPSACTGLSWTHLERAAIINGQNWCRHIKTKKAEKKNMAGELSDCAASLANETVQVCLCEFFGSLISAIKAHLIGGRLR